MATVHGLIDNSINQDQHQLRLELDRRKTILRLNAEEHRLVQQFYELKPRETEITSAKIIWKAINEQQNITHEINIFKRWLEVHTQEPSNSLDHIKLPNIYHIFTTVSFQHQTSSIEHLAEQTIAKAEQIMKHYHDIAIIEKNKLQSTQSHHKNPELLEQVIHAIHQRQKNLQQRREHELEGQLDVIFKHQRSTQMHN